MIPLDDADVIAARVLDVLRPWCDRVEVAGSVRRRKPMVKDLEVVAIPAMHPGSADLFGAVVEATHYVKSFEAAVRGLGDVLKGDPACGRYVQVALADGGINLDLFCARAENWGLIYAIRTGSAEFSHKILASGWVRRGYHSKDGMLVKDGRPVPVPEEKDLFRLAGVPYVCPAMRFINDRDSGENPSEICGDTGGRDSLQPV